MQLRNVRALRGPNVWTQGTVLEAVLELISWSDSVGGDFDAFRENLGRLLPGVLEPLCEPCRQDAAVEATSRPAGLLLSELFVRAVVELQSQSGSPVSFGRVAEMPETGNYRLAIQYREEPVGRQALDTAVALFQAARSGQPFPVADRLKQLRQLDQQIRLGPSTGSIVRAAVNRGIPFRRLNEHSLVQIGYGSHQHRILAAETDKTSAVAETIVQDKHLTKQLLEAIGVPVPKGRQVTDAEDAWAAAQDIGLPVVVKPKDGSQGRGVAVNLATREQVLAAYSAAFARYDEIIVEKYAVGADYRLLIINQQLVAAARREPPLVIGDGRRTIRELVDEVNLDPRRGEDHATSLSKIPIDAIAEGVLADQGLNPGSTPAAGQIVLLRRNANLSTGGSATDVTDVVHPEITARAIDAARMVGLDIAGVDVIAQDISRPLEQQGGVIIEVNAAPGLRMHLEPSSGQGRPVGEAIINMMFPDAESGRIPIVAVTGVNGKTTTTRLSAHILRCWGKRTGMTCTDGVYINDRRVDTGDCSGPKSARNVLSNPVVEAAVLETARGGILREGLGFDRSDVSIVTNMGEGDHLGLNGIDTLDQLARVKRILVENVAPTGYAVLNAADPLTAPMAAFCPGKVLFFARSENQPVLAAHRARGGKAVFIRDNAIIAAEGEWEAKIADLAAVPLTMGGLIGFQIENAMAAAAGAWTLGVPFQIIRHALETFVNTAAKAPARFNVVKFRGATIVIDYGHNVSAIEALLEAFGQMPHERRLIVYTAAGDRRDEDIIRQAELIADGFDHWVLYEDACTRGRADGEVIRLMKQGIQQAKRLKSCLETRGEFNAISMTLDMMQAGDLVLVQADQVEAAIQFVDEYLVKLTQSSAATKPVSVG